MFQYSSDWPQIKPNLISSITNFAYNLPLEFLYDRRLRIPGNQKRLEKPQIWVETQPTACLPFQKQHFGNSSQKVCKNRYQSFTALLNFTRFLYFVPDILYGIADLVQGKLHLLQLASFSQSAILCFDLRSYVDNKLSVKLLKPLHLETGI